MLSFAVRPGLYRTHTFKIAINPLFRRASQYGLFNAPSFLVTSVIACVIRVLIPFCATVPRPNEAFVIQQATTSVSSFCEQSVPLAEAAPSRQR